jgi:hypothetical protein
MNDKELIWESYLKYIIESNENSIDNQFFNLYKNGEKESANELVKNFAASKGYDFGPAAHSTNVEQLEDNKFKLSKAGSRGGERIDYRRPAIYFATTNEEGEKIYKTLEDKGMSPRTAYGKYVFNFYLKIDKSVDLYSDTGLGIIVGIADPSRIKLADPFTFDDNKELIPLSQRFNIGTDDVRY